MAAAYPQLGRMSIGRVRHPLGPKIFSIWLEPKSNRSPGDMPMKNKFALSVAAAVCAGLAASASAQQTMLTPPKVLVIAREVVKTGKSAPHEKWETGWPRAFSKANWPVHYLAASAITGESRVLFMTGYESLAAWEQDQANAGKNAALSAELAMLAEKNADFISEVKTAAFTYMPDWS